MEELDFSAGSLDPKDSERAQSRRRYSSHPSPPLEGTAMVPYNTGNVSGLPKTTPSTAENNQSPLRPRERTPRSAQTTPDRVAIIREGLRTEGLSLAATHILLSSWSEATQKRYAGPWRTWAC